MTRARPELCRRLPAFLPGRRWFGGKARRIRGVRVLDAIALTRRPRAFLLLLQVRYASGPPERYLLPLSCVRRDGSTEAALPGRIIASVTAGGEAFWCCEGVDDPETQERLLTLITRGRRLPGLRGVLAGKPGRGMRRFLASHPEAALLRTRRVLGKEQSNTAVLYGNALFFKIFRRLEEGTQPDIEVVRFLSETAGYANVPPFAGSIEYRRGQGRPIAVGSAQEFIPNRGDGWGYALSLVARFFDRVRSLRGRAPDPGSPFDAAERSRSALPRHLIGRDALGMASLLGRRTGELHCALASDRRDPAFAPVPSTRAYQRALVREQLARATATFRLLRGAGRTLPPSVRKGVQDALRLEHECLARLRAVGSGRMAGVRIRCHGDYHLGQVLYTGRDFVIIDFEGEPATPLRARREKHPPFRDVAGMMRSFHYAAYAGLLEGTGRAPTGLASLHPWADAWYSTMAGAFLSAYLESLAGSSLLPEDPAVTRSWLKTFFLDKAVYEIGYELNNRPAWLQIPLSGIRAAVAPEPD
jgi:maltose alpha-D-glucosyltransferase/alpha-amylase